MPVGRVRVSTSSSRHGRVTTGFSLQSDIVVNYLVSRGVNQGRSTSKSFGKERPVAICNDISCWSQNRRAVTVVQ